MSGPHPCVERVCWEVTRVCEVACLHCRANEGRCRDTLELSLSDAARVVDHVRELHPAEFWLVGGDPLQRPDLEMVAERARGMRLGVVAANTGKLTPERLASLRDAGVALIGLKLDGPDADSHDGFRGVPGAFDIALSAAESIRALGMDLRVETLIGPWNHLRLESLAERVRDLGASAWEWTPAIPVGRAVQETLCTRGELEVVFDTFLRLRERIDLLIRMAEAPQVRRYAAQHGVESGGLTGPEPGRGQLFINYKGDVSPNGYLAVPCGDARRENLAALIEEHFYFRNLRDHTLVGGKCAACDFLDLCGGGSRSRAYITTGDPRAEDPACAYQPAGA